MMGQTIHKPYIKHLKTILTHIYIKKVYVCFKSAFKKLSVSFLPSCDENIKKIVRICLAYSLELLVISLSIFRKQCRLVKDIA